MLDDYYNELAVEEWNDRVAIQNEHIEQYCQLEFGQWQRLEEYDIMLNEWHSGVNNVGTVSAEKRF